MGSSAGRALLMALPIGRQCGRALASLMAAGVIAGLAAGGLQGGGMSAAKADGAGRAGTMAPARDPAIAVEEEYRAARAQGTAEALALFIARHGDSPQADAARAELRRLTKGGNRR